MRIFIVVFLVLLVVIGALYGARLLWRVWHPSLSGQDDLLLSRRERWAAWGLVFALVVLFLVMIGDRLALDDHMPDDWTTSPAIPLRKSP